MHFGIPFDCMMYIFSFLDRSLRQWVELQMVCYALYSSRKMDRWVSLLYPVCTKNIDFGCLFELKSLQALDLSLCRKIVSNDVTRNLSTLTQLQILNLEGCTKVTGLASLDLCSSLRVLNLSECKINDHSMSIFDSPEQRKTLDHGAKTVGGLIHLQTLDMERCVGISDTGFQILSHLTNLTTLKLSSTKIGDCGLAAVGQLTTLQMLILRNCQLITNNGIRHLASLCVLQELNLRGCDGLTDLCLTHVAFLTRLETLILLGITAITNAGVSSLRHLSALQTLNLAGCGVTDGCLPILGRMRNLQVVHACGSGIRRKACEDVPHLDIRGVP